MFRTLVAAVVAVSLIGGPVLAQGTATPTNSNQPAASKTNTPKINVSVAKTHSVKTAKHVKHHRQIVHVRHIKQVKQAKHSAKNKPAG